MGRRDHGCPICGERLPPPPVEPIEEGADPEDEAYLCPLLEVRICRECCRTVVARGDGDLGVVGRALGGGFAREQIAAWVRRTCAECPYGIQDDLPEHTALDRRRWRSERRSKKLSDREIDREKRRRSAGRRARRRRDRS